VCCEFDLLVPPLRGTVVAGDQPHPVQTAEVAVDERVARLRLLGRALGRPRCQAAYSSQGASSGTRSAPCARLHVLPTRAQHVLARVDQPLRVPNSILVERVGGHGAFSPNARRRARQSGGENTLTEARQLRQNAVLINHLEADVTTPSRPRHKRSYRAAHRHAVGRSGTNEWHTAPIERPLAA
jgi:hypothetical protein